MTTSVTLKIETTAPAAMSVPGQVAPVTFCEDRRQAGLLVLEAPRGLRADGDDGDGDVERGHRPASAKMIASGRFRRGFFTSSPAVETASSPM